MLDSSEKQCKELGNWLILVDSWIANTCEGRWLKNFNKWSLGIRCYILIFPWKLELWTVTLSQIKLFFSFLLLIWGINNAFIQWFRFAVSRRLLKCLSPQFPRRYFVRICCHCFLFHLHQNLCRPLFLPQFRTTRYLLSSVTALTFSNLFPINYIGCLCSFLIWCVLFFVIVFSISWYDSLCSKINHFKVCLVSWVGILITSEKGYANFNLVLNY